MNEQKKPREFVVYEVVPEIERQAGPFLAVVEGSEFVQQDSWVNWQTRVIEHTAYNQAQAEIKRLREALESIRDYVDNDPTNAHAADCALVARQALSEGE